MHILFQKFFNIEDTVHFPDNLEMGFQHLIGFGYLKKKTASDSFIIKKCEDPLLIRLHNEAVSSYHEFVDTFNSDFANKHSHRKNFYPLQKNIDTCREELEFQFINKNNILVLYTNHFEFKSKNGQKDNLSICYRIPIDKREPIDSIINFALIKVPCSYNYYSESALDFKQHNMYYPVHAVTIAYIAYKFSEQIKEHFENIDKFVDNFDENIKILTMLTF